MGGTATASGSAKTGKVNDVVEDANWRQRINAETEAAECWRHEWGFLLSQNGADAGLDNSFTERARAKMKEMEAVQAARDEDMDASAAAEKANELFLKTFKKKHKAFPKYVHRRSKGENAHTPFFHLDLHVQVFSFGRSVVTHVVQAETAYMSSRHEGKISHLMMRHALKRRETHSSIEKSVCCPHITRVRTVFPIAHLRRPKPQEQFPRPALTSHEYGWDGGTLERFGRLTCKLR